MTNENKVPLEDRPIVERALATIYKQGYVAGYNAAAGEKPLGVLWGFAWAAAGMVIAFIAAGVGS